MSVSAGLPQLPLQLLRALSQNLSDSPEATSSQCCCSGLGSLAERAAWPAYAASAISPKVPRFLRHKLTRENLE